MRDRTKNKIVLTLIRHGSTTSNEEKRYLGRTDEVLSAKGICEIAEKKYLYNSADLLFVSPMLRCRQTADILFPDRKAVAVEEWKEIDFGRFEGKNYRELFDDCLYRQWVDSGCKGQIPEGERLEDFIDRSMTGLDKCLKKCEEAILADDVFREHISAAAIVHGGTIMSILSKLTDSDYFDFNVKNGEGYILEFEDERFKSKRFTGDNQKKR